MSSNTENIYIKRFILSVGDKCLGFVVRRFVTVDFLLVQSNKLLSLFISLWEAQFSFLANSISSRLDPVV